MILEKFIIVALFYVFPTSSSAQFYGYETPEAQSRLKALKIHQIEFERDTKQ